LSIYEIKESGSAKCNRSEITSPIYSGTRCAANNAGAPGDLLNGIDLILCIPADTIVLPYTIYLNSQLANETTNIKKTYKFIKSQLKLMGRRKRHP
jgi:hypothetical protein